MICIVPSTPIPWHAWSRLMFYVLRSIPPSVRKKPSGLFFAGFCSIGNISRFSIRPLCSVLSIRFYSCFVFFLQFFHAMQFIYRGGETLRCGGGLGVGRELEKEREDWKRGWRSFQCSAHSCNLSVWRQTFRRVFGGSVWSMEVYLSLFAVQVGFFRMFESRGLAVHQGGPNMDKTMPVMDGWSYGWS